MKNIADIIESFIIEEMLQGRDNSVLVQRNELATRLDCAPSQISYVLNTRFTFERGYMVESRRGSGGFVKILRVEPEQVKKQEHIPSINEILEYWLAHRMITIREAKLLSYMLGILNNSEEEKREVLQRAMEAMTSRK